MKKVWILCFLAPLALVAQKPFPTVWETKFAVDSRWNAWNDDLSLVFGGDLSELEMLDGMTGKSLWTVNIKETFGVKSCEDWAFLTDLNVVKVLYKKPKSDETTTVFLDARTGKQVGEPQSTAEQKKQKSGKSRPEKNQFVFQDWYLDEASSTAIMLGYDDKALKNAMGGTNMNVRVSATGGYEWESSFEGKIVTHLCYELLDETVILNLFVAEGKVFVVHEGISVLDLKTGKLLWQTTFDYTDTDIGLKAKQEIGRSAWPVVTKDAVYICDLSKGEKAIKKLDIQTGKVIWTGEKLSKNDIISYMAFDGGNLLVKFGGLIMRESFAPDPNGGVGDGVYKVEYVYEGTTELRAFDPSNGQLKWTTKDWDNGDNFKKSPCNMLAQDGKLYICSDKLFYRIDPATGNTEIKQEFGAKSIGLPQFMYASEGTFYIEGEEGIAAVDGTGKLIYATSTGKCLRTEWRGDAFIVWTGKDLDDRKDFVRFDLATGQILGKMEDCYRPRFDTTGDFFLRIDKGKVTKYKTN